MTFLQRRIRNTAVLLVISLFLIVLANYYGFPRHIVQLWSGWSLMALIFLLLLYSIKKKFILLPLGKSSSWLQIHSYAGILSCIVFFQHISFQLPNGNFEIILAILFICSAISGIVGLFFSRIIPKYLTRRGEEVIFERIPQFIYELRAQSQALVLECTSKTNSVAIAEYYKNHLASYFYKQRNILPHCYGSLRYLQSMQNKHKNLCRYLNPEEYDYAEQLLGLVIKKYDLDFHYALQGLLKVWLFVHISLAYSLIILAIVHAMLVYAFIGNM